MGLEGWAVEGKGAGETAPQLKPHWLPFHGTWDQFPALTWWPTTVCNGLQYNHLRQGLMPSSGVQSTHIDI